MKKILIFIIFSFIFGLVGLLIGILLVIPIFYSYGIDYINESNFNCFLRQSKSFVDNHKDFDIAVNIYGVKLDIGKRHSQYRRIFRS